MNPGCAKLIFVEGLAINKENLVQLWVNELMSEEQEIVLIGKKPIMNYVVACLTLFNAGRKTVTVKARGVVISHAVDTVELLHRAFIKDLTVQSIKIGSQQFERENGSNGIVSTIDIVISKG